MGEVARGARARVGRQIAAQCEQVLDPLAPQLLEHAAHLVARIEHRDEVGHRGEAELALDPRDQRERERAARLVERAGHRDEVGAEHGELAERLEQRIDPGVGLRREELEREHRPLVAIQFGDAHGAPKGLPSIEELERTR